jgi:hypothetical protein
MQSTFTKGTCVLAFLTVILGGLPFAIYFVEKKLGVITNSELWYATGASHGPWRGGVEVLTIYYPVVILLIVTFMMLIYRGGKTGKRSLIASGVLLALLQIAILFMQMYFLTWTID